MNSFLKHYQQHKHNGYGETKHPMRLLKPPRSIYSQKDQGKLERLRDLLGLANDLDWEVVIIMEITRGMCLFLANTMEKDILQKNVPKCHLSLE